MSTLTGVKGSVQAGTISGNEAVSRALQEALADPTPGKYYKAGEGTRVRKLAEEEAAAFPITGDLRRLFIRERVTGRLAAGQLENVTEDVGVFKLLEIITFGLVHVHGGSTTVHPPTHGPSGSAPSNITSTGNPGTGEEVQKAASEATSGALSGLGSILEKAGLTVVLALAGLALVIYGVMIAVKPRDRAFSLGLS